MIYRISEIPRLVEQGILPPSVLDLMSSKYDEIGEILSRSRTTRIITPEGTIEISRG